MNIAQMKEKLPKNFYDRFKLLYGTANEEEKQCRYLEKIAETLLKETFDFKQHPVYFCVSASKEADVCFIAPDSIDLNSLSIIMVTKGLFSLVQNEDQLAFLLGRELDQLQKFFNSTSLISGLEENDADFICLERMAAAGYNLTEAGRITTHILTNGQRYDHLASKLSQTLAEDGNNESRINAIELKIKQLETFYQKKGKDIRATEPRPLPEDIKENIRLGHYIPTLQQILLTKKYDLADMAEKQDILIQAIKDFIIEDRPSEFLDYKHRQIQEAIINYVIELRHEMPAHLLSSGNYNLLTGNSPQEEEIRRQLWKEATEHEMPESISLRKKFLHAFPIKIVPDEKFMEAKEENNLKRSRQQKEIAAGDNLNVLFWSKLIDTETAFADTPNLVKLRDFNGFVLNGINNIDLTKIQTGKNILNVLEKMTDSRNRIDEAEQNLLISFLHIQDFYDAIGIQDDTLPLRMRFYNIKTPRIFKKFNAKNFPALNLPALSNAVGKSLPVVILINHTFAKLFGIFVKEISKTTYLVGYNSDYKKSIENISEEHADHFYIVNKDGQIIDSFTAQERKQKVSALINATEDTIYQKIADKVQKYYDMLQAVLKNAGEKKYSAEELLQLKMFISARNDTSETYKLSPLEYYREISKDKSSRVKLNRKDATLLLQRDFIKHKYESGFEVSIGAFDFQKLKSRLKPETANFIRAPYNEQNDNTVFAAYLKQLTQEFPSYKNIWDITTIDFKEDCLLPDCASVLQHPHNAQYFTEPQLKKYYNTLLQNADTEKLMQFGLLARERVVLPELKNLAVFALTQLEETPEKTLKDVDFKAYQPLYADQIAKLLNFPTDFAHFAQMEAFNADNDGVVNLQMHILLYLLTSEQHHFPLDVLAKYPIHDLLDIQTAKLVPYLTTRENYPQDTVDMADTYKKLYDCRIVDFEATIGFIIRQIKSELNPQKALAASLKIAEIIKHAGTNRHKDSLIKNNPAFDTSLFGKITAYQKLSAAGAFADDFVMQNRMLESFIPEIEAVQEADIKNSYYDIFISKHHRIADPDIRRRYHQLWVQSAFAACGSKIDDNSSELYEKVRYFTDKLNGHYIINDMFETRREDNINPADRIEISQNLAERLISQQKLSALIKPWPANFADMELSIKSESFQTVGFQFIKNTLRAHPEQIGALIRFLISKGNLNDGKTLYEQLASVKEEKTRMISAESLHIFYREFWNFPPEARVVLLNELLCTIHPHNLENKWETIFDEIAGQMFLKTDKNLFDTSVNLLRYYILAHRPADRTLPLVAMMSAAVENTETTDMQKSVAKGFRLFLENMGPEAVRVGQTLGSYTDIPKFIRDEFLKIKPTIIRPSRWEIYEWLDFYKNQENDSNLNFGSDVWIGKFVTSSLYFVTIEKGRFQNNIPPFESDEIIKLLRAGAKISAENEFNIFENALRTLVEKNLIEIDLNRFLALIHRTREKLNTELDIQIGYDQFKNSRQIYSNREFKANGYKFKVHIADWKEYGKNWAVMDFAKGYELDKIKNLRYRQAAAKVCFSLEVMNLLSGGRFYHERFGLYVRFDTNDNIINLVDVGAAPVVPPVAGDKELLGAVIYRTLERFMHDKSEINGFRKISVILNSEIDRAYKERQTISTYLQECQRGLLALADFYTDFSSQDFIDSLNNALNNPHLLFDSHIMKGFIAEGIKSIGIFESEQPLLSVADKEKLGSLLFNIYASSLASTAIRCGNVIKKEIIKMRQNTETAVPLLKIISENIKDLDKESLTLDIPKEFMPSIGDLIIRQNVDSAILKGIMKEVIYTISDDNLSFPAADLQEFGRLLYDTFSYIVSETQQGKNTDIGTAYLLLYKSGNYHSAYAARIAAVVLIAQAVGITEKHHGINAETTVASIILSGKMNQDIVKGTAETFRSRNPNSLTRSVVAKGLELFLTQKQATPDQLKKALIKVFVKKKNAVPVLDRDILSALETPENRPYIVKMMQIFIQKLGGGK